MGRDLEDPPPQGTVGFFVCVRQAAYELGIQIWYTLKASLEV